MTMGLVKGGIFMKRYIKNISKPGTWGDFICLRVLSEILKVKFNLLILNTRNFQVISNNDTFKPLMVTEEAMKIADEQYYQSWLDK